MCLLSCYQVKFEVSSRAALFLWLLSFRGEAQSWRNDSKLGAHCPNRCARGVAMVYRIVISPNPAKMDFLQYEASTRGPNQCTRTSHYVLMKEAVWFRKIQPRQIFYRPNSKFWKLGAHGPNGWAGTSHNLRTTKTPQSRQILPIWIFTDRILNFSKVGVHGSNWCARTSHGLVMTKTARYREILPRLISFSTKCEIVSHGWWRKQHDLAKF